MSKKETIFIHLPAYRDPELIPTIKDALDKAKYPKRIHFGICRQYHPDDKFDDLSEYKKDKRFNIYECLYTEAKGLPWARAIINEQLLGNQDYILQLDSHHRFNKDWDVTLIEMHNQMEKKGHKPILAAYLPLYNPFNDPEGRADVPWQQQFACFYPHGTIFIRPALLTGWQNMTEPAPSRFLSGHFCFARSEWAREIKHDPDIYFSGEEINLTVRSYTHGYDMFHPHKLVIWHSTMREERAGRLKWDDDAKHGVNWWNKQDYARKKIRSLFRVENNPDIDLTGYDLGDVRSIEDYEAYAGVNFKSKSVQKYTLENKYPPNPVDSPWSKSFYHLVNITRNDLPKDDYTSILVAFDDENGIGIYHKSIEGYQLDNFIKNNHPIHYEEFFTYDGKEPKRFVAWAYSKERGWAERIESQINL
jgi:hypothetical protein